MKVRVLLMTAALAAVPSWGAAAVAVDSGKTDEIHEEVSHLKDAVADYGTTDAKVFSLAQDLFGRMPSTKIVVNLNLRGWDREPMPEETPADTKRLVESADKRLTFYNGDVPKPMAKAMAFARGMQDDGRMNFDERGELGEHEMGEYRYWVDKLALGSIKLNNLLSLISAKIGDALAFATVIHEAGHARDHQEGKLNPRDVIDGEVLAFQTEYQWLKVADPYDERICFMRTALINQQREKPTRLGALALNYLNHLAQLQETKGDPKAIRELAIKLGYKDGETKRTGSISA